MVNPRDPWNHGKPLWVVYGHECAPSLMCAVLRAYTGNHELLPAGTEGQRIAIWGYSVFEGVPGFRTLGLDLAEWSARSSYGPHFFAVQGLALNELRRLTAPIL